MQRLTLEQAVVLSAYTQIACCPLEHIHAYIEKILGRSVLTHEIPALRNEIKAAAKADFLRLCVVDSAAEDSDQARQLVAEFHDANPEAQVIQDRQPEV